MTLSKLLVTFALTILSLAATHADSAQVSEPVSTNTNQPIHLTLEDVLERIANQNLRILLNNEAVEEALQASLAARSGLLPRLDFDAIQSRNQAAVVGRNPQNQRRGPQNRLDFVVRGSVPLIDLNRIADYQLAKQGHRISELRHEALVEAVLAEAANAFFLHIRNLNLLEVIDANIERDMVLLDITRSRFDVGVATQLDVTRSEVTLAGNRLARLQQETVVYRSEQVLKRMLDLPADQTIVVTDTFAVADQQTAQQRLPVSVILDLRPDYQEAVEQQKQNQLARDAAGWQHLPTLSLFGEFGYAAEDLASSRYENQWAIGAAVSVPIFEGFRIRSNKLQADARIRAQDYQLRNLRNQIGSEYRIVLEDLQSRAKQISIARQRIALSRQELLLATNRFEEGVADNREVVDAQSNLAQSEDELVEALYLYNLSKLQLAYTLGDVRSLTAAE